MRKAQSDRMKGIEPKAASEGAKKWHQYVPRKSDKMRCFSAFI